VPRTTNIEARPPIIPGKPCKLCTPQVSKRSIFYSKYAEILANPYVDTNPATAPTIMALPGPRAKLQVAPIATPPAKVAF